MRVSTSLSNSISIVDPNDNLTQKISTKVKNAIKDNHKKTWVDKNQHGFITTRQKQTCDYNEQLTHSWYYIPYRRFICAIQEQEIRTRALIAKREQCDKPAYDKKCWYCHNHTEDIFHLLSSCSHLSASLYLPVRHNEIAKVLYNAIIP